MKKFISLFLMSVLILSLCVSAFAEPATIAAVKPEKESSIEEQIKLIYANLSALSKDDAEKKEFWHYAVTDLDHNGRVEFIVANTLGRDYFTYACIYEVGEDLASFIQCDMGVKEGDPFVDIIADSADTYYDKTNDTWYYMFTEGYAANEDKFYAVKCSVSLKEAYVAAAAYAKQTTEAINGVTVTSFLDMEDNIITPDEFNAAGDNQFAKLDKSSTNFDWFTMDEVKTSARLSESYEVFSGIREAKKKIEIVPAPTPTPSSQFLMITKNPTSENGLSAGDTCWFVAYADNATSIEWTLVSPNGGEYSATGFEKQFIQCDVSGERTVNLCIQNVSESMSGWGAYCTFWGANGQVVRSTTAYMNVKSKPQPVPEKYWQCGYCGHTNKDSVDFCGYCGRPRHTAENWMCSHCGYVYNEEWRDYCAQCGSSRYTWGCNYCGYAYNDTSRDYCEQCGRFRYAEYWTCGYCGYSANLEGSIVCEACGNIRGADAGWTCEYCGTRNRVNDYYCTTCGHPQYYYEESADWQCGNCGVWNDEYEVYCAGCGIARSGNGSIDDVIGYEENGNIVID